MNHCWRTGADMCLLVERVENGVFPSAQMNYSSHLTSNHATTTATAEKKRKEKKKEIIMLWHLKCHHNNSSFSFIFVETWGSSLSDCFAMKLTVCLIDSRAVELSRICCGACANDIAPPVMVLTFWSSYLFCTLRLRFEGHFPNHFNPCKCTGRPADVSPPFRGRRSETLLEAGVDDSVQNLLQLSKKLP